ncbi:RNA polymerase Rpb4 [Candidatus Bathyarchaeota archaeon CG_4_8_14_3_um_filter_42_8]|nr:MAG: RNA polymerase Rpb4 [Candidatus Bathyarchaeota archaeon CG_4_8_14_3_um_filter_42_8]
MEMAKNAIREKNLTVPQVKKLLVSLGEENLDQFQRRTLDYASKFSKVDAEASEKLMEKLVEKFGLEEEEAIQVVNCMPKSVEELRVFLSGGRKIIETSKLEAIVNLLDENRKLK